MADRVLPSREDAKEWAARYAGVVNPRSMVDVVAAYGSGRLVDREAIDREGARATATDVLHCDVSTPEIDLILDAALGVGD